MGTTLVRHTELGEIRDVWNSIEARNGLGSPLQSFAYTRLWYDQFSTSEAVRVFSVWSQGDCLGIIPLELKPGRGFPYLSSLKHEHTQHCPRIILRGREPEFAACFLRELVRTSADWSMCKLGYLYSFEPFGPAIEKATSLLQPVGSHKIYREPTYCVDLKLGLKAYLQGTLSKNTRKSYRQKLARAEGHFAVRTVCLRGRHAAAEWDTFLRMEDSGWKGVENTSIHKSSPKIRAYYHGLNDILIENDSLYLFLLLFDDTPAAGLYCYADDGVLHTWKGGYAYDFQEYSPSNIMRVNTVKYVVECMPHISLLHGFPGTYGYKHRYNHAKHNFSTLFIFRNTLKGRLMEAACVLKRFDCFKGPSTRAEKLPLTPVDR
jgi:CelD/BcsL family acetyltransferase involved in cellulose biosynthesis